MTDKKQTAETTQATAKTDSKAPALKFKRAKLVTLPLLKPQLDVPFYVRIEAPVFLGKEIKGDGVNAKMEPAHIANCTNLETGEMCQIIIPTVLLSILTEEYENESYVGKSFELVKLPKPSGKRYHGFTVAEIEVE